MGVAVRKDLSSLTGLSIIGNRQPSTKVLGYVQRTGWNGFKICSSASGAASL